MPAMSTAGNGGSPASRRSRALGFLAFGIAAVGFLIISISFWPGHMSADTLLMIDQASGTLPITDQHSPFLIWLWSLAWPLGLRPAGILTIQVAVFLLGAYLVARAAFSRIAAAVVAVAVALSPPVLGYLGTISRDAWFTALLLLCFGLLIASTRREGRAAKVALGLAALAGLLALTTRQNAAPAVAVAFAALLLLLPIVRLQRLRPWLRGAVALAAGSALALALAGLVVLGGRAAGVDQVRPQQQLYIYDLAQLSIREGRSLFPASVYPSGDVATLAATASVDSPVPLIFGPDAPIPVPLSDSQVDDLQDAWVDAVKDDPRDYLDLRIDAFGHQLAVEGPPVFVYHPGIDANDRYTIEFSTANDLAIDYLQLFADDTTLNGGLIDRPWIYLLLAIGAGILLLRSPMPLPIAGALGFTALTYQSGLFIGTMATQYRFEYPAVVVGMLVTVVAVKALVDRRRRPVAERAVSSPGAPERPAAAPTATVSG